MSVTPTFLNLETYTQQLRYQEAAKKLHSVAQQASTSPEIREAPAIAEGGGLEISSVIRAAVVALPTVLQIYSALTTVPDTVLVDGPSPLKQSLVTKVTTACGLLLGAKLTLDEESTLAELMKAIWKTDDRASMQLLVELGGYTSALNATNGPEWIAQGRPLLERLTTCSENPSMLYWLCGVQVRAHYYHYAFSAEETRKAYEEANTQRHRAIRLDSELVEIRKKLNTANNELEQAKQSSAEAEKKLQQLMTVDASDDMEKKLRVLFVQHGWKELLVDPDIPVDKVMTARKAMGIPQTDKVIALEDLTVFGSAKSAHVFGLKAYYHRHYEKPVAIPYGEFGSCAFTLEQGDQSTKLLLANASANLQLVSASRPKLHKILTGLQEMFRTA